MTLTVVPDSSLPENELLPVLDGPWTADSWLIERPTRFEASGAEQCRVGACNLPAGRAEGDPARPTDVLCVAHRRRLMKRGGGAAALDEFVQEQASASPIRAPRGANSRQPHYPAVDFWRAPARLANELRHVTSIKVRRQHWKQPEYVNSVLRGAIDFSRETGADSLTSFDAAASATGVAIPSVTASALRSMVELVQRARTDPWESDVWHPVDLGVSEPSATAQSGVQIHWTKVTCDWLRLGLKELAKTRVQGGTVAWSTLRTYVRGGSLLSAYMVETGEVAPHDLTRGLYLEFAAWVRDESTSRNDIGAVTSLAQHLFEMRRDGIEEDLPETMFLLRGENPNPKVRQPKPLPADTLTAIDALIADDGAEFPLDTRLMLRLFKAACPRPSEALTLPVDCIEHTSRGYSLRYYQTKVDEWRIVPLPPRLGEDLAAQAAKVRDEHGGTCDLLFPYAPPRGRTNTLWSGAGGGFEPWSYSRFSAAIWALYQQHGIGRSSVTGERMTGAQLHRFRHSIATALLAEGWTQYEVQKFLGHKSATMMQSYAEINDEDQHARYVEFVRQNVDITGQHQSVDIDAEADAERFRDLMVRSTLPNGFCTLPEKQSCDFLPNPCLSCTFFRTTPTFLPIHVRQRDDSMRELDLARADGRERAAEVHERTVETLDRIIEGLEAEPEEETA